MASSSVSQMFNKFLLLKFDKFKYKNTKIHFKQNKAWRLQVLVAAQNAYIATRKKMDRLIKLLLFPLTFIVSLIDQEMDSLGVGVPCVIDYVFDIKCWGCGISHAIISIWHGDFSASFQQNKFGLLIFVVIAGVSFKEFSSFINPLKIKGKYNG